MPVTLIATPGDPLANSYATVAEATAYNDGHMNGSVWTNADVPTKNRALVHATRLLDTNVDWKGERASETQALEWPRAWAINRSGSFYSETAIPQQVKFAVSELARRLIESGGSVGGATGAENLKRLKAGPVELDFKDDAEAPAPLPDDVFQMVKFLSAGTSGAGVAFVPVRRV